MLIALDWGLTRFRAYLMDGAGAIVERREAEAGVLALAGGDFAAALDDTLDGWPAAPVVAAGMITSRQGWVETPYLECPAGAGELARALTRHEAGGRTIHFVPGLTVRAAGGVPDVMRGEEVQIVGALPAGEGDDTEALFLLPGTHSKWARAEAGRVRGFASFMTGEIFAVLRDHSILGRMMTEGATDGDAFARGLDDAWREDRAGGLLHRVFGTRSLALFDELTEAQTADYLSGLLIGTEVADGLAMAATRTVTIVGTPALAARYETALRRRGAAVRLAADDIAATGLFAIARAGGLSAAAS